ELESAQTLLVAGLPPGRISEIAKSLDAKMIVIGSRGLTGLPHLMIGSVAERVVHLASQPVVVVKSRQVTADEQPHSPVETQDNDSE
ncbi:MAG TPA: universal stress protein, partial [Xanthomonadales bacterium]|nr:universal stress protein [Xanthomonadales bacterium]